MKLQSHIRNSKKLEFVIQTIISFNFFYLVISLSIVNDLSNPFFEVSLIERDGKGTHFF